MRQHLKLTIPNQSQDPHENLVRFARAALAVSKDEIAETIKKRKKRSRPSRP